MYLVSCTLYLGGWAGGSGLFKPHVLPPGAGGLPDANPFELETGRDFIACATWRLDSAVSSESFGHLLEDPTRQDLGGWVAVIEEQHPVANGHQPFELRVRRIESHGVVEALDNVVPLADAEIGKTLARSYKKRGMTIRTGTKVKSVDRESSPMILTVERNEGEETIETDVVLMAVGRAPVTAGLGLEELGIELNGPWVKINEWCETNVPGVYAIGDVAGEPMLAHKGSHEGMVTAEKIAGIAHHPMRYDNIPSVGYCHPEIATIGMTEDEAKEAGHEVKVGKYPLTAHGRALTAGHPEGFIKIVTDAKYGEILGVHMIGYNVSELIGEAGMARALESTVEEIAVHAHAHPSMAEAVMEAALAAMDRAIHM